MEPEMKTFSLPARTAGRLTLAVLALSTLVLAACGPLVAAAQPDLESAELVEKVSHAGGDY